MISLPQFFRSVFLIGLVVLLTASVRSDTIEFDGFNFENGGVALWSVSGEGDEAVLKAPSTIETGSDCELNLSIIGPGLLTLSFDGLLGIMEVKADRLVSGKVELDSLGYMEIGWGNGGDREFSIELLAGQNRVQLVALSNSVGSLDFAITDLSFEAGYPVEVADVANGVVVGVPDGRVQPGETVVLEAQANEGFVFYGWTGTFDSDAAVLEWEVDQPVALVPAYARTIEGEAPLTRTGGNRPWVQSDGIWSSPAGLKEGEVSWIDLDIPGPAYFGLTMDGSPSGVSIEINGVNTGRYVPGSGTDWLFKAENHVRVLAEGGGGYIPGRISDIYLSYLVEFGAVNASIESDFDLGFPNPSGKYSKYIEAGTELNLTVGVGDGSRFSHWDGDLAEMGASASVVVTGPIDATAWGATENLSEEHVSWSIDGGAYLAEYGSSNGVFPTHSSSSTTLMIETDKIGRFGFSEGESVESFSVRLNGEPIELVENSFLNLAANSELEILLNWKATLNDSNVGPPRFVFEPGVYVSIGSGFGGSIVPEFASGYYEPGTRIKVSAVPSSNNRFVGWEASEAVLSSELDIVANSPFSAAAHFEAIDTINGVPWDFEGVRPAYVDQSVREAGWNWGIFYWKFRGDGLGFATAKRSIVGPAVAIITGYSNGWEGGAPLFFLDGQAVEGKLDSGVKKSTFRFEIPPGEHTFEYRLDVSNQLEGTGVTEIDVVLTLPLLTTDNGYQLKILGRGTNLEDTTKGYYSFGESVNAMAPERNSDGDVFQGWWYSKGIGHGGNWPLPGGMLLESGRSLSFTVSEEATYVALYGPEGLTVDGGAFHAGNLRVAALVGELTPNGAPVFEITSNQLGAAQLGLLTATAGTYRFWLKFDPYLPVLGFMGASIQRGIETRSIDLGSSQNGWYECSVYLEKDTLFQLGIPAYESEYTAYFGGFERVEGWSPPIVGSDRVSVARKNGKAELSFSGDTSEALRYWVVARTNEGESKVENSVILVEKEDSVQIVPKFEHTEQSDWGPISVFPFDLWKATDETSANLKWNNLGLEPGELRVDVEGPTLVHFRQGGDGTTALVDDLEVDVYSSNGESWFEVPSGMHEVKFSTGNISDDFLLSTYFPSSVELVKKEPGYLGLSKWMEGGEMKWSPSDKVLLEGGSYTVEARPRPGYEFVGWEAPYESKEKSFSLVVSAASKPSAIFRRIEQDSGFVASGLSWSAKGLFLDLENQENEGTQEWRISSYQIGSELGSLGTEVHGPGVFYFNRSSNYRLRIDGEDIPYPEDYDEWRDFERRAFYLDDALHLIELVQLEDDTLMYPAWIFEYKEGFPVSVELVGADTTDLSGTLAFRDGDVVEFSVVGAAYADDLVWTGLPEDTVFDGSKVTFTVRGPIFARGINWHSLPGTEWQARSAGNPNWSTRAGAPYGIVSESGISQMLKVSPATTGVMRFKFVVETNDGSDASIESHFEAFGKDVPLLRYEEESHEALEGFVAISETSEPLSWEFKLGTDFQEGREFEATLVALEFVSVDALNPFQRWWFQRGLGKVLGLGPLLQEDADGDGLGVYDEYLVGTDPLLPDRFLNLTTRLNGGGLEIFKAGILSTLGSRIEIEVSETLGVDEEWNEIGYILGNPFIGSRAGYWVDVWHVGNELEKLFFRMKTAPVPVESEDVFGSDN